jgi:hypothetical protein
MDLRNRSVPLLRLHPEEFDEILGHLPRSIAADIAISNVKYVIPEHGEPERTLRALTHTCSDLRRYCLPKLWQRVENCIWVGRGHWYAGVIHKLTKALRCLKEQPRLQPFVQYVSFQFNLFHFLYFNPPQGPHAVPHSTR